MNFRIFVDCLHGGFVAGNARTINLFEPAMNCLPTLTYIPECLPRSHLIALGRLLMFAIFLDITLSICDHPIRDRLEGVLPPHILSLRPLMPTRIYHLHCSTLQSG